MRRLVAISSLLFMATITSGQKFEDIFNNKNLDGWYVYLQNQPQGQDPDGIFSVSK